MLFLGEVLITEEQHEVAHQRVVDLVALLVAERLTEIDTTDLRADVHGQRIDGDGLVGGHATAPLEMRW